MKTSTKKLSIALLVLFITSCNSSAQKNQENNNSLNLNKMTTQKNEIVNVSFFYLKPGQEKKFEKLRSRGNVLLEKYGAKIERVIKPTMIAEGTLDLPTEVHFASYPNIEAKEAFDKDPEFLELKKDYVASSVEKMFGFITKNDSMDYFREIGDTKKTYGIALVYINENEQSRKDFAEYHQEACAIMPEFGTHFERFLIPVNKANDLIEQPSEIHRFYFDSPEGLMKMGSDQRMQALFPKRNASMSNLIFIVGEAIQ